MTTDISNMTTTEISKLPRQALNDLIRMIFRNEVSQADKWKVLGAAQYRIIDLEYELERVNQLLEYYKENEK